MRYAVVLTAAGAPYRIELAPTRAEAEARGEEWARSPQAQELAENEPGVAVYIYDLLRNQVVWTSYEDPDPRDWRP